MHRMSARSISETNTTILHHRLRPTDAGKSPSTRNRVEQIVVAFKTHFDIGYTDLARNVVEHYRTLMIDKALDVCEASTKTNSPHRFVWTLPGWPMAQILWPGQTPDRRHRITTAIDKGQLVWHALPASLHTESMELEDIVRGLRFSSDLSRQHGVPLPRDSKMTDVPSHCWIVPTLLKHAGVDFLHIGCNEASASPDVPPLFWWEGPDGSRLLTMYTAGNYGTGLKAPNDWPCKTWLALIHTSDNHGPPCPEELQKLAKQARDEMPGVPLRFGRLSDFADAILRENPALPVIRADMPDTWIYGIGSMPAETALARRCRPRIGDLELLGTLLGLWGINAPNVTKTVADAYENSLMFGEHTWGYCMIDSIQWHYGDDWQRARANGQHAVVEESWAEKGDNVRTLARCVDPAIGRNMALLAQAVRVTGPRIVVFNPLPWACDRLVQPKSGDESRNGKHSPSAPSATKPAFLRDVDTGEIIGAEMSEDKRPAFVARNVPPLGYRTYVPADTCSLPDRRRNSSDDSFLENEFFQIRVNAARGTIDSLIDKRTSRELVDGKADLGFAQYLYERFDADIDHAYLESYCKVNPWPDWSEQFGKPNLPPAKDVPYTVASPEDFQLSMHRGHVSSTAIMTVKAGPDLPHHVRIKITLWQGYPFLDVELSITGKTADPWPEAGWLCFPLNIEQPTFRLARLGAVIDPAQNIHPGANHEVFCLNGGMTVRDANGQGMGLCPLDSPLVSLGRPGLLRYTQKWSPREPRVFVNLFNNVWGTNFQQWISDVPASTVRIWSAGPTDADLVMKSWESRRSPETALFDGLAGSLPPTRSGIELSRPGVLVTAFGPNPDGQGVLLRLWEQIGSDEPCRIRLPDGLQCETAQPCDLRGVPLGKLLPIRNHELLISLQPNAPVSLLFDSQVVSACQSGAESSIRSPI